MTDKLIRLTKALWHETVKRIPYILVVLLILIFAQLIQNTQIARQNAASNKRLLERVASLSQDNKNLSEQNQELSQQNIDLSNRNSKHIDCLANTFAHYTQTLTPVKNIDLQNCTTVAGTSQTSATGAQGAAPSNLQGRSAASGPSSNDSSNGNSSQSGSSQNPPSFFQRIKNFLNGL